MVSFLTPVLTAFSPFHHLPIRIRLRLIGLQFVALLVALFTAAPLLFRKKPFQVRHALSRDGEQIRYLIYYPPNYSPDKKINLHVCIHSGGFVFGSPESTAAFCQLVARELNSVVVSPAYRFAPLHPFPAAVNDAEDILLTLLEATPELKVGTVTVSGFSAGANISLGLSLNPSLTGRIDACVSFCGPLDRRTPRADKRWPEGMKFDPFIWLGPLFDTYNPPKGSELWKDDRIAPGEVADLGRLPKKVMLVVAGIDVLCAEQIRLARKLGDRAQLEIYEARYHGWLEAPGLREEKKEVYGKVITFLKEAIAGSGRDS